MEELGCGEGFDVRRAKLVPCVLLRTAGKTWRMTERWRGRETKTEISQPRKSHLLW